MALSMDQDLAFGAGAVVTAVGGAALLLWGLFRDRARGRLRCPRCWYDMQAAVGPPYTCPECGKVARTQRALKRTRRRRQLVALAMLMFVGAYLLSVGPDVRRRGWWAAPPRVVILMLVPHLEDGGELVRTNRMRHGLYKEIRRRTLESEWKLAELTAAERAILRYSCLRASASHRRPETRRLAAHLLVLLDKDAMLHAPENAKGDVAIAQAAQVLANCRTYRDRGSSTSTDIAEEKTFLTAFQRTGEFRFEILHGRHEDQDFVERTVVWATPDLVRSWSSSTAVAPPSTHPSLFLALLTISHPSADISVDIPFSLAPERLMSAWRLTDTQNVKLIGEETVHGDRCDVVTGTHATSDQVTFFISKETRLIRRISVVGQFTRVTDYHPEINADIDPAWFDFIPAEEHKSPLQRPVR